MDLVPTLLVALASSTLTSILFLVGVELRVATKLGNLTGKVDMLITCMPCMRNHNAECTHGHE